MKTRGAIIKEAPGTYEVVDLEVDDPRQGEIQVKMVASGLCHSDDHVATGDIPVGIYPFCGGHEGAGVVTSGRPEHAGVEEGDHVVFSFLPVLRALPLVRERACRTCATSAPRCWSAPGGTTRPASGCSHDGQPVGQMCGISTFCEVTTVAVDSAVKVPDDIPLDMACLLGCGVGTGWGSAVNSAEVQPG